MGLAVSLHAASDALRNRLVPVNRRYPVADLIQSCRTYAQSTGRRVSFEYALIDGINDDQAQAKELGKLLRGRRCHGNLIPINPTAECEYRPSSRERSWPLPRTDKMGITIRLDGPGTTGWSATAPRHISPETQARDEKDLNFFESRVYCRMTAPHASRLHPHFQRIGTLGQKCRRARLGQTVLHVDLMDGRWPTSLSGRS